MLASSTSATSPTRDEQEWNSQVADNELQLQTHRMQPMHAISTNHTPSAASANCHWQTDLQQPNPLWESHSIASQAQWSSSEHVVVKQKNTTGTSTHKTSNSHTTSKAGRIQTYKAHGPHDVISVSDARPVGGICCARLFYKNNWDLGKENCSLNRAK